MTIKKILEEALLEVQQEFGLVITDIKVDWSRYASLDGKNSFHISGVEFSCDAYTSTESGL